LSFFLDQDNHRIGQMQRDGRARFFYEIPWNGRHVWGATAGMIRNLSERLLSEPSQNEMKT
jgi:hypothetical protein